MSSFLKLLRKTSPFPANAGSTIPASERKGTIDKREEKKVHGKKMYEIPGFFLPNLPGTETGYIIPGQGGV